MLFLILVSRQGKCRLSKWYSPAYTLSTRALLLKDLIPTVLARRTKQCHIMDYKGIRVVYKKYASLWFIVGVEKEENALLVMDIMHRFVEALDRYFGNVSGDI